MDTSGYGKMLCAGLRIKLEELFCLKKILFTFGYVPVTILLRVSSFYRDARINAS